MGLQRVGVTEVTEHTHMLSDSKACALPATPLPVWVRTSREKTSGPLQAKISKLLLSTGSPYLESPSLSFTLLRNPFGFGL